MSERYKTFDAEAPYFTTFTLVEWLHLFDIEEFATILVDSLKYCVKNKGLLIFGYCIMPSHVHLIVQSSTNPLGSTFRDLKKFTSSEFIRIIKSNEKYQKHLNIFKDKAESIKRNKYVKVWLDGYHPEIIFSNKFPAAGKRLKRVWFPYRRIIITARPVIMPD